MTTERQRPTSDSESTRAPALNSTDLRVGVARAEISPAPGEALAAGPPSVKGERVELPLFVTAMAFESAGRTSAIVGLDLIQLPVEAVGELRTRFEEATGIAADAIGVICTHTHNAPRTSPVGEPDFHWDYLDFVQERAVEALTEASVAFRPALLRFAECQVPGWTFNRRPVYASGQVASEGPAYGEDFVRFEGPTDDTVQLIMAVADDGLVGGLVSFACHATVRLGLPVTADQPVYSADFPGGLTDWLSRELGGHFIFASGPAGDLFAHDLTRRSPRFASPHDHIAAMASALGAAVTSVPDERDLGGARISVASSWLQIPERQPSAEQVKLARWYLEEAPAEIDEEQFTQQIYGHPHSAYGNPRGEQEWLVRELLGIWEAQSRSQKRTPSRSVEIQAFAFGAELAVVLLPVELFVEFGQRIRAESPFPATVIATLSNGDLGYVPTREAFERGGYEPRLGNQSKLAEDAGDRLVDEALRLLRDLHGRPGG